MARKRTSPPSSTTPTSSFVPPASSPMTGRFIGGRYTETVPERPEYTVYRSRKGPLSRLKRDEPGGLAGLRRERRPAEARRVRKPISAGRVLKRPVLAVLAWGPLSFVVFVVTALLGEPSSDTTQ